MKHLLTALAIFIFFNGITFVSIAIYCVDFDYANWGTESRFCFSICLIISLWLALFYYILEKP